MGGGILIVRPAQVDTVVAKYLGFAHGLAIIVEHGLAGSGVNDRHHFFLSAAVVRKIERAVVAVALAVIGGGRHAPGAFEVDVAREREVEVIAQGEKPAYVLYAEAPLGRIFVVAGEEQARAAALGYRKKAKGQP